MTASFSRISAALIYRQNKGYKAKHPIPTAPEVKTYDAIKSLIDSKFSRICTRRTRTILHQKQDIILCEICGQPLKCSETYLCKACDDELLPFDEDYQMIHRGR